MATMMDDDNSNNTNSNKNKNTRKDDDEKKETNMMETTPEDNPKPESKRKPKKKKKKKGTKRSAASIPGPAVDVDDSCGDVAIKASKEATKEVTKKTNKMKKSKSQSVVVSKVVSIDGPSQEVDKKMETNENKLNDAKKYSNEQSISSKKKMHETKQKLTEDDGCVSPKRTTGTSVTSRTEDTAVFAHVTNDDEEEQDAMETGIGIISAEAHVVPPGILISTRTYRMLIMTICILVLAVIILFALVLGLDRKDQTTGEATPAFAPTFSPTTWSGPTFSLETWAPIESSFITDYVPPLAPGTVASSSSLNAWLTPPDVTHCEPNDWSCVCASPSMVCVSSASELKETLAFPPPPSSTNEDLERIYISICRNIDIEDGPIVIERSLVSIVGCCSPDKCLINGTAPAAKRTKNLIVTGKDFAIANVIIEGGECGRGSTTSEGANLQYESQDGGSIAVQDCEVRYGRCGIGAGNIFARTRGIVHILNSAILGGVATYGAGYEAGGVMVFDSKETVVDGCRFDLNIGPGLIRYGFAHTPPLEEPNTLIINNSIFTHNQGESGSAMIVSDFGTMQRLEVLNSRFAFNEHPAVQITFVVGAEVFWHDNYNDGDYSDNCPVRLNVDPIHGLHGCYYVEQTISN